MKLFIPVLFLFSYAVFLMGCGSHSDQSLTNSSLPPASAVNRTTESSQTTPPAASVPSKKTETAISEDQRKEYPKTTEKGSALAESVFVEEVVGKKWSSDNGYTKIEFYIDRTYEIHSLGGTIKGKWSGNDDAKFHDDLPRVGLTRDDIPGEISYVTLSYGNPVLTWTRTEDNGGPFVLKFKPK